MSRKIVIIFFALLVLTLSACERVASTPLPTQDANFPAVAPTSEMSMVEQVATQTAMALTGTPQGGQPQTDAGTPVAIPTFTPLAGVSQPNVVDATATPQGGVPVVATALPSPTPGGQTTTNNQVPVGGNYTLQKGEFPYCIARRYNLNPDDLLAVNGLSKFQDYYAPGTVLKLPASGTGFPGARSLKTHPAAYTVQSGDTIYSIACEFGDVDPMTIATTNNLPAPYTLTVGAQINIP